MGCYCCDAQYIAALQLTIERMTMLAIGQGFRPIGSRPTDYGFSGLDYHAPKAGRRPSSIAAIDASFAAIRPPHDLFRAEVRGCYHRRRLR
jgi:hypothetical protein